MTGIESIWTRLPKTRPTSKVVPTDIGAQNVLVIQHAAVEPSAKHAACRPGIDNHQRPPKHRIDGTQSAIRLHDQHGAFQTQFDQLAFEPCQVVSDDRPDIRVEGGRNAALIFANSRRDLRRDRYEDIGDAWPG